MFTQDTLHTYKKLLHGKCLQALEQTTQESDGVTIPGAIICKTHVDVALGCFSDGLGSVSLMVRLTDLQGPFQPK